MDSVKDSDEKEDEHAGLSPPANETDTPERLQTSEEKGTGEPTDLSDDDDLLEYELTITDEEKRAGKYALAQMQEKMTKKKEEFQKWSDKMTTRRMYALGRSKKLEKYHRKRMEFYGDVGAVLKNSKVKEPKDN